MADDRCAPVADAGTEPTGEQRVDDGVRATARNMLQPKVTRVDVFAEADGGLRY